MPTVVLWLATMWCQRPSFSGSAVVMVLVNPVQTPKVTLPSLLM